MTNIDKKILKLAGAKGLDYFTAENSCSVKSLVKVVAMYTSDLENHVSAVINRNFNDELTPTENFISWTNL